MEILLADNAGFCFGVKRAVEIVFQTAKDAHGPVFTLGPLIHNSREVERLKDSGIGVLYSLSEVESGDVLVIRSHGLSPKIIEQAMNKGLKVVDATCPFVKKAQKIAETLIEEQYTLFIVGDKNHPEVNALMGYANKKAVVVGEPEVLNDLSSIDKAGVITQTTQTLENLCMVVEKLLPKCRELRVFNTICTATERRQRTALDLANKVDTMIVIGGKNSANTARLVALCASTGIPSYHIEGANELKPEWFANIAKVGVTAGASTPNWIIEEVIARMKELAEDKVQEKETEACMEEQNNTCDETCDEKIEETTTETQSTDETSNDSAALEESFKPLKTGDYVTGTVVAIVEGDVMVDVSYKSDGIIPKDEFEGEENLPAVGDEINVFVENIDNREDGGVLLSKKKADRKFTWEKLQAAFDNREIIEARVKERVKGGLLVDMAGVRGFVPASQISREYVEDLEQFVGQTLRFYVIELDRDKNNVVLSRREVLEEEFKAAKAELFDTLEEGTIRPGEVKRITDFGAFVDIGSGVEGLLHVSEMAWSRVGHPSEVVSEGDEIKVMILGIDKERERISLGLKQTKEDPWLSVEKKYNVDDVVTGTVTKIVDFGAFVKLEDGIEGLIHISQLANRRVGNPSEVVSVGEEINVKILNVSAKDRRIGLSLRALEEPQKKKEEHHKDHQRRQNEYNDSKADMDDTVTIGDMVGNIFNTKDE